MINLQHQKDNEKIYVLIHPTETCLRCVKHTWLESQNSVQ